jgi:hypothetical protein
VPDLDAHLDRSRTELLGEIDQPPIAAVRRRAGALRRRRRAAVAGSAFTVIVAAGVVGLHPWDQGGGGTVHPGASPAVQRSAQVYTGSGITINGLQENLFTDLPGQIADVAFVDPDHGYVVSQCPTGPVCTAVSVTEDGGETFTTAASLPAAARSRDLAVVPFPRGQALLVAGAATFATADEGRTWQQTPLGGGRAPASATPEQILRLDAGVHVWDALRGDLGRLVHQPSGLVVRWVAARPAGDGAWWVGGVAAGGEPSVAVTRDGGASWTPVPLPSAEHVTQVRVATLGSEVWAVATGDDGSLGGVYHSADDGATFAASWHGGAAPARVSGDPVPLLDGRLLLAEHGLTAANGGVGGSWWLSADDGATFTVAASLPAVGRLAQTGAGYVAYELFAGSWAAYSADGSTWNKLQAN